MRSKKEGKGNHMLTKKALKEVQKKLYALQMSHCDDSYNELWKAIDTLVNLGLLDRTYKQAMIKTDSELFNA